MAVRRARGAILRLVRRRPLAIAVGIAMAAPAVWMESGWRSPWWLNGLGLVLGATGAALIWAGVAGPRGDWTDQTVGADAAGHAEKD